MDPDPCNGLNGSTGFTGPNGFTVRTNLPVFNGLFFWSVYEVVMRYRFKRRYRSRKKAASRSYRRYRRYRRAKRRARSRYRRKISKPEVKMVNIDCSKAMNVDRPYNEGGEPKAFVYYTPGACCVIGSGADSNFCLAINNGVNMNQRIGNKIRPIKLRIFGNLNCAFPSGAGGPYSCSFRCLVVQMKSAIYNTGIALATVVPYQAQFSSWNPVFDPGVGDMSEETYKRFFYQQWIAQFQDGARISPGVSSNDFARQQSIARMPFRPGFGKAFRVLYDHVYTVGMQQQRKQNINFRIKTKCPKLMEWIPSKSEVPGGFNTSTNNGVCVSPIYVCWFFIPHQMEHMGGDYGLQRYNFTCSWTTQLYFVDP